jgi:hypothetical protein
MASLSVGRTTTPRKQPPEMSLADQMLQEAFGDIAASEQEERAQLGSTHALCVANH